jgi:hypothetical protein
MIQVLPMTPEHPRLLLIQQGQPWARELVSQDGYCESLATAGPAFVAEADGKPVACFGVVERHPNVCHAWGILDTDSGRHMLGLTRAVRQWLETAPYHRIDIAVAREFDAGHRWALLLGFTFEGMMRRYLPAGGDAALYARVR